MLNIPNKEIFKQDSVHKNLRITFLDGSLPDITNENIEEESLVFTESVSSNDFELGVAEASVLKFRCFNQSNFRGKAIRATIECDGVSVSLGVFTVDECKRLKDLISRDVVAYSSMNVLDIPKGNDVKYGTYEYVRRRIDYYADIPYDSEVKKWLKMMTGNMLDPSDTLSTELPHDVTSGTYSSDLGSHTINIDFKNKKYWFKLPTGTASGTGTHAAWNDAQGLYFVDYEGMEHIREDIKTWVLDDVDNPDAFNMDVFNYVLEDAFWSAITSRRKSSSSANSYKTFNDRARLENYLYPYVRGCHTGVSSYAGYTIIEVPYDFDVVLHNKAKQTEKFISFHTNAFIKQVDTSAYTDIDKAAVSIPRTKSGSLYVTVMPDDFSFYDLARSYATFSGSFGVFDRETGNLTFRQLGEGDAIEITASDTEDIEYDEEQAMFTSVHSSYKDSSGNVVEYVSLITEGIDNNPYYVNNNYMFNNGFMTAAQVQSITDHIAEVLTDFKYVPCNIRMVGLPYMEAGDHLNITLWNGEQIQIPVLRRTLEGIQTLKDTIDVL